MCSAGSPVRNGIRCCSSTLSRFVFAILMLCYTSRYCLTLSIPDCALHMLIYYYFVGCIGVLVFMGNCALLSDTLYTGLSAASVNIFLGVLSAVIDNIPIMFAVLTMSPDMSMGNWLFITLTAGVGGSLLSIGSAAGVALVGHARGMYTCMGHLTWAPVLCRGYIGAIVVHLWVNAGLFQLPV